MTYIQLGSYSFSDCAVHWCLSKLTLLCRNARLSKLQSPQLTVRLITRGRASVYLKLKKPFHFLSFHLCPLFSLCPQPERGDHRVPITRAHPSLGHSLEQGTLGNVVLGSEGADSL